VREDDEAPLGWGAQRLPDHPSRGRTEERSARPEAEAAYEITSTTQHWQDSFQGTRRREKLSSVAIATAKAEEITPGRGELFGQPVDHTAPILRHLA
jgi:hypothetical protein